jgi:hypothetical protein
MIKGDGPVVFRKVVDLMGPLGSQTDQSRNEQDRVA